MITPLKDLIVEVKMKNKLLLLHKEIVKKRIIKNLILSWDGRTQNYSYNVYYISN